MDTLKLSKWKVIIILFFSALFFINRECKKNEEEMLRQNIIADKNCYNDTIISMWNIKQISIDFLQDYEKKDLKGLKIEQIRNGKKISNIRYAIDNLEGYKGIDILDTLSLHTRDSLIFTFSDNEKIILREFRNGGNYGSKKFLGCIWDYCIHGQDTITVKGSRISIPSRSN